MLKSVVAFMIVAAAAAMGAVRRLASSYFYAISLCLDMISSNQLVYLLFSFSRDKIERLAVKQIEDWQANGHLLGWG